MTLSKSDTDEEATMAPKFPWRDVPARQRGILIALLRALWAEMRAIHGDEVRRHVPPGEQRRRLTEVADSTLRRQFM